MASDYPRPQAAAQPCDKTRKANVTRASTPARRCLPTGSHRAIHPTGGLQ